MRCGVSNMTTSEIINTIIALISLGSAIAAFKAANSSRISAQYSKHSSDEMKKQTAVMEKDLKLQRSPLMVPLEKNYEIPYQPVVSKLYSKGILGRKFGDLEIDFINSGKGNAYEVQSWLEVSNLHQMYEERNSKKKFNDLPPYYLCINHWDNPEEKYLTVKDEVNKVKLVRYPIKHLKNSKIVLHSRDSFSLKLEAYAQIFFIDYIHRLPEYTDGLTEYPSPDFILRIRYKEDGLHIDKTTEVSYRLVFSEIKYNFSNIEFSIQFKPISNKVNPIVNSNPYY